MPHFKHILSDGRIHGVVFRIMRKQSVLEKVLKFTRLANDVSTCLPTFDKASCLSEMVQIPGTICQEQYLSHWSNKVSRTNQDTPSLRIIH